MGADSLLDRVSLTLSAELAMLARLSADFYVKVRRSLLRHVWRAFIILPLYRQLGKTCRIRTSWTRDNKKTSELSIYTLSGVSWSRLF